MAICSPIKRHDSCSVSDLFRSLTSLLPQQIADAAHDMNVHARFRLDQRAAQLRYVCVQCIGLNCIVEIVDRFLQHFASNCSPKPQEQRLQYQQLASRQVQQQIVDERLAGGEIETQ